MTYLQELVDLLNKLRSELDLMEHDSFVCSALDNLDDAIDDLEDKLAAEQLKEKE